MDIFLVIEVWILVRVVVNSLWNLVSFVLLMVRVGVMCMVFGLVVLMMRLCFCVVVMIVFVIGWLRVMFMSRLCLCILLISGELMLLRILCSLVLWWVVFLMSLVFLILVSMVFVMVVVSGLLLNVELCDFGVNSLFVVLYVMRVLIGKFLLMFLVRVIVLGVMFLWLKLNYWLVWLVLVWILFMISRVLCVRVSDCVVVRYLFGSLMMLVLFWMGFMMIVVIWLLIVVLSVLMVVGMCLMLFGIGVNGVCIDFFVVRVSEFIVCLWKLFLRVMMCGCLVLLWRWVSLNVVLFVLVFELEKNICLLILVFVRCLSCVVSVSCGGVVK